MKNILAIALLTLRIIFAQLFTYVLLFALALTVVITLAFAPELIGGTPFLAPVGLGAALKAMPSLLIQVWRAIAVFHLVSFAASSIAEELKERSLITILAHPLSRVQYLLGKWLAVLSLAIIFYCLSELALTFHAYSMQRMPNISLYTSLKLAQSIVMLLLFIAAALSFSAIVTARAALICAVVPLFFTNVDYRLLFPADSAVLPWMKVFVFLTTPLELPHTINLDPQALLGAQIIILVENLAYIALMFLLSACYFEKRDLRSE